MQPSVFPKELPVNKSEENKQSSSALPLPRNRPFIFVFIHSFALPSVSPRCLACWPPFSSLFFFSLSLLPVSICPRENFPECFIFLFL